MDKRKKSAKNFLYQVLGQAVTIAFGLILPRLFIVSYGSEVNGLLHSLSQFLVYLGLFEAGVGAATMQALYKPIATEDWDSINGVMAASDRYYKQTGRLYFIGLLALTLLYPLIVDSTLPFLTVCGAVFFSGIGNVVLFYFYAKYRFLLQADGKSYIITNLSTLSSVLTSLSKVVLIHLRTNIVLILAVSFLLQCLQAAYILWYIRSYPRLRLDVPPNMQALAQKNFALIHQVSTLIFRNTDVLILTVFCGLRVVSVYSTFMLVVSSLESILRIPLNSIDFILAQNYQTNKALYTRRTDLVDSYHGALLYALFSVALFLYLPFLRLYTAGVTDINYIDPWLAVLFVLVSLLDKSRTNLLSTISYAGHFRQTLPHTILESAINLTASLVGVYFLGIYGVLIGTVVALTYRTNSIFLYTNHKLLNRSAKKTYFIYGLNIALFLLTQSLLRLLFDEATLNSYPRLIVAGFGCTALSLVIHFGGQTLLFSHCRSFVQELYHTLRTRNNNIFGPQ